MRFLKTNTATRVTVGPFFDKTDGITPEVALTATNEKLTFLVDDGGVPTLVLDTTATASGGSNDLVHVTNDDAGYYDLELAAANVNYLGRATLAITYATDHLPVFHEFMILSASAYDALFGATLLTVNATQIGGTSQTGRDIGASVLLSSGTGTGQVSLSSGTVTTGALSAGAITAASLDATVQARLGIVAYGTAQSVSAAGMVLDAGTSLGDDALLGAVVVITGGSTGVGQARVITDFVGSTDTITVDTWAPALTGTITYVVFAAAPASTTAVPSVNIAKINGVTIVGDGSGTPFNV
jgi:hypothetical protein